MRFFEAFRKPSESDRTLIDRIAWGETVSPT